MKWFLYGKIIGQSGDKEFPAFIHQIKPYNTVEKIQSIRAILTERSHVLAQIRGAFHPSIFMGRITRVIEHKFMVP